ncbi:hypothetical protein BS614_18155 [Paenibacillus xylanexedens]|uniref:hypothetical protein n=1 Tax=Paenibacillus xylanexedens TaxID=528191 RepID=UPI0009385104|nr:hypothetical protein [Paenibacillus xylanexedens]APO45753.1 hypothetical protein BS614_18155 [Paenibacillus xylanexedens]
MFQPRSIMMSISLIVIVLTLVACSGSYEPLPNPQPSMPVGEPAPAPSTENEQPSETDGTEEANETERPQTASFEMLTADGNQSLEATLQQGEGFSLYVFEKFTFDATQGRLSLTSNADYYVDIEPLPSDYNLAELETAGKEELVKAGKVSDYSGELVEHPLGYAELYLQASGEEGISDYMVWKSEEGDAFLFRLHNPKGEEASDFASPVLVSLSTVQGDA